MSINYIICQQTWQGIHRSGSCLLQLLTYLAGVLERSKGAGGELTCSVVRTLVVWSTKARSSLRTAASLARSSASCPCSPCRQAASSRRHCQPGGRFEKQWAACHALVQVAELGLACTSGSFSCCVGPLSSKPQTLYGSRNTIRASLSPESPRQPGGTRLTRPAQSAGQWRSHNQNKLQHLTSQPLTSSWQYAAPSPSARSA